MPARIAGDIARQLNGVITVDWHVLEAIILLAILAIGQRPIMATAWG